jgi:hypothetical protein
LWWWRTRWRRWRWEPFTLIIPLSFFVAQQITVFKAVTLYFAGA